MTINAYVAASYSLQLVTKVHTALQRDKVL